MTRRVSLETGLAGRRPALSSAYTCVGIHFHTFTLVNYYTAGSAKRDPSASGLAFRLRQCFSLRLRGDGRDVRSMERAALAAGRHL